MKTCLPALEIKSEYEDIKTSLSDAQTEGNHYTHEHIIKNVKIEIPELDQDMAWFIGIYISSLRLYSNDHMNITILLENNQDIIDKIKSQIKRFWDFEINVHVNKSNIACIYTIEAHTLAFYLNKHININEKMRIPEFITQSDRTIKAAFIEGILDGYIKNKDPEISVSLTEEIQNICTSIGINTQIIDNKVVRI